MQWGMGNVVVVGTVNQDLVLRVERLPLPGQTILATGFVVGGGGKGDNQAAAAASAGAHTALVAAVGDDDAGRTATRDLAAAGVDVGHLMNILPRPARRPSWSTAAAASS